MNPPASNCALRMDAAVRWEDSRRPACRRATAARFWVWSCLAERTTRRRLLVDAPSAKKPLGPKPQGVRLGRRHGSDGETAKARSSGETSSRRPDAACCGGKTAPQTRRLAVDTNAAISGKPPEDGACKAGHKRDANQAHGRQRKRKAFQLLVDIAGAVRRLNRVVHAAALLTLDAARARSDCRSTGEPSASSASWSGRTCASGTPIVTQCSMVFGLTLTPRSASASTTALGPPTGVMIWRSGFMFFMRQVLRFLRLSDKCEILVLISRPGLACDL